MVVGLGYLQQTAADGVAWQRLVQRGTTSEDESCGNGIVGQLGLQRTAAGCSVWLGYPVQYIVRRRRKRHLWLADMMVEAFVRLKQRGEVDLRWRLG